MTFAGTRPLIPVAAGCLVDGTGRVLIAQRPAGKIAAGKWEFPGGKIEPRETPRATLVRELHEELGIEVLDARPLIRIRHDYSDRTVILDTWRVTRWRGEVHGRENQAFDWVEPQALHAHDLLAADLPIGDALRLPCDYVFTPPDASVPQLLRGLDALPPRALLRLRLPALTPHEYAAAARELLHACRGRGVRLVLDREIAMVGEIGADGWHATSKTLRELDSAPLVAQGLLMLASCHGAEELQRARLLGFHAAVLGPVLATSSHPQAATLGWPHFATLVEGANLPVYAIGGVGPDQHAQVHAAYGQGTAGISAYWS